MNRGIFCRCLQIECLDRTSAFYFEGLEVCQGFDVDLDSLSDSWLTRAPNLRWLGLRIASRSEDDVKLFFTFLTSACPMLRVLRIRFQFCHMNLDRNMFTTLPQQLEMLFLCFVDVFTICGHYVEGDRDAEQIAERLKQWIEPECRLIMEAEEEDLDLATCVQKAQ